MADRSDRELSNQLAALDREVKRLKAQVALLQRRGQQDAPKTQALRLPVQAGTTAGEGATWVNAEGKTLRVNIGGKLYEAALTEVS